MKKLYIFLILFLFLLLPINVSASEKVITCDYFFFSIKGGVNGDAGFRAEFDILSDNTVKWRMAYQEVRNLRLYESLYETNKSTGTIINIDISISDELLLKLAKTGETYRCPTLFSSSDFTNVSVIFSESYSDGQYLESGYTIYSAILKDSKFPDSSVENKLVHNCDKHLAEPKKLQGLESNVWVSYRKYSSGRIEFCVGETLEAALNNCKQGNDVNGFNYFHQYYNFQTKESLWQQIFNNNSCPELTVKNISEPGYDSYFYEISYPSSGVSVPDDDGTNLGDPIYGCQVIPDDIREWIKDALNLLKYVALALVIVLGVLDFIKAAASGEAEDMKKSGQSFMKRIIAVIILFLLPVIVDLVLNLIELYGANSTCLPE